MYCLRVLRQGDFALGADEVRHEFGEGLIASRRPAILHRNIAALDPAQLPQPLDEGGDPRSLAGQRALPHEADRGQPRRLRARRERPCRGAAEQRYELAAFQFCGHSITSSARASSLSGIIRPSGLVVLRLTRNATSSRSLQFSDAKRLKRVDRAGILLMIVELEKSDGDRVDREVDKDEAVLLDRFEVLFHLQMHGWCRPDTAECGGPAAVTSAKRT